jgi:ClpP class serine protease
MWWLLSAELRAHFKQMLASGVTITAAQQIEHAAAYGYDESTTPRILQVAGDVATITINGVMTKGPSLFAMLFGGGNVTYPEIVAAIDSAERNPAVKRTELIVDSPGGQIDGLFETIAALQSRKKPLKAVIRNTAASAMYAMVAQADEIVATNRAVRVGSVGIVVDTYLDPNEISITSTEAPNKRPDLSTEEGRAVVREGLDALHQLFVEAIATGRGMTVEKINAEFGRGGTLLADEALKRGMIDGIQGSPLRVVKSATSSKTAAIGGINPENGNMDLATLKAQHPDVYAAAMHEGVTAERERVSAHLIMGEASGAMDTATAAIKSGDAMTATLQATYMAAGMNRKDQSNRQNDSADAAAAASLAAQQSTDADATGAEQVLAILESNLGIK